MIVRRAATLVDAKGRIIAWFLPELLQPHHQVYTISGVEAEYITK